MTEQRLARLEQGMDEAEGEWVALEHAMIVLALEVCAKDPTAIERIHRVLTGFSHAERQRGEEKSERRATAIEVLADRLLRLAREDPRSRQATDGAP